MTVKPGSSLVTRSPGPATRIPSSSATSLVIRLPNSRYNDVIGCPSCCAIFRNNRTRLRPNDFVIFPEKMIDPVVMAPSSLSTLLPCLRSEKSHENGFLLLWTLIMMNFDSPMSPLTVFSCFRRKTILIFNRISSSVGTPCNFLFLGSNESHLGNSALPSSYAWKEETWRHYECVLF